MNRFFEPVNGFTHLFGAVLAVPGLLWLLFLTRENPTMFIPALIFGVSMLLVYIASTSLHLIKCCERTRLWLNRFDHAAIYLLIAGTYTPIAFRVLDGYWRWFVLGNLWFLAALGIGYKLLFLKKDGVWSTVCYVLTGVWGALLAWPYLFTRLPAQATGLIITGGLVYLAGAVVFALRWPNLNRHFGFHELWHLFVLGGSGLHYAAIALIIIR